MLSYYVSEGLIMQYYVMDEYDDYNLKSEVRYISYLRFLQNRVATETSKTGNSTVVSWKNPIEYLKTPYGFENSFK